jgi:hypothetical protein
VRSILNQITTLPIQENNDNKAHTTPTMKAFGNDLIMTGEMSTTLRTGINLWPIEVDHGIIELPGRARLRLGGRIHEGRPSGFIVGGPPASWIVSRDLKFAAAVHSEGRRLITRRPTTSDDERGR